ncbi:RNA binding protein [Cryptococcus neoformans Bt15]|nr:RNA binding protein [Cryptococcus neoformans var. grubii Bt15]
MMAEVQAPPPAMAPEQTQSPPAEQTPAENGDVEVKTEEGAKQAQEEGDEDPNKIPDNACETLYLQNLNEKVRIPVMKETLYNLFKPYRPLQAIIAHHNIRMRGQAFVSFPDIESANEARKDVNEFPLYGKSIQIQFAKGLSDSIVKRKGDEREFEEHTKRRLEEKKLKRKNNPLRQKSQAKLRADTTAGTAGPAAKKQRLQMPDEYLPPNSVLFVQNLPDGTTSEDLREVFEVHPGLIEIRTIPAKKDIAFVEFADEGAATIAKDALHNFKIDGETKMKVTYARK